MNSKGDTKQILCFNRWKWYIIFDSLEYMCYICRFIHSPKIMHFSMYLWSVRVRMCMYVKVFVIRSALDIFPYLLIINAHAHVVPLANGLLVAGNKMKSLEFTFVYKTMEQIQQQTNERTKKIEIKYISMWRLEGAEHEKSLSVASINRGKRHTRYTR